MALKYIGEHGAALDGIPARDLSDDEVRQFGEAALLATGLYAKAESAKPKAQSGKLPHANDNRSVGTGWNPHKEEGE